MSSERPNEISEPQVSGGRQPTDERQQSAGADSHGTSGAAPQATVLVRGETIRDQEPKSPPTDSSAKSKARSSRDEVSKAKVELQNRLPALDDDSDIGVQKEHIVTRDGEADLAFTGTLVASAAPSSAPKGQWQEYRIYETNAGKHVFSRVTRNVLAEEQDTHKAEVFDPSPSSVPSKLLRSAHDLTHSRPLRWTDAAVDFFGYDPLAKSLYQKLGTRFEEHIS
jgi:hypothetical protein